MSFILSEKLYFETDTEESNERTIQNCTEAEIAQFKAAKQ